MFRGHNPPPEQGRRLDAGRSRRRPFLRRNLGLACCCGAALAPKPRFRCSRLLIHFGTGGRRVPCQSEAVALSIPVTLT